MAFIGNQPFTAAFLTDTFSGNGSTVAFTMTVAPANTSSILVSITGVVQDPSTYSVSGTTLTFSAAPPSGTSNISVRYLGIPASGVTTTAYRTVTNTTATAGQTTFTIPSYTVGYVDVYRNGVYLPTTDYTASTGTTVVLNNAATAGDTITTVSFYVSSVLNAIPATAGSVSDSYIVSMAGSKLTGTQVIPKATLPTGSVLQVVSTQYTSQFTSSTGNAWVNATGFSATITPSSTTSKILLRVFVCGILFRPAANAVALRTTRNGTAVAVGNGGGNLGGQSATSPATSLDGMTTTGWEYLDSPASTSAQTYQVQLYQDTPANPFYVNTNTADQDNGYGRAQSSIVLMEIAA